MDGKHILGWKKPDYGSNQKGAGRGGDDPRNFIGNSIKNITC